MNINNTITIYRQKSKTNVAILQYYGLCTFMCVIVDRTPVFTYLPLAFTKPSPQQEHKLMEQLDSLAKKHRPNL